jgi:hypothetical protein
MEAHKDSFKLLSPMAPIMAAAACQCRPFSTNNFIQGVTVFSVQVYSNKLLRLEHFQLEVLCSS